MKKRQRVSAILLGIVFGALLSAALVSVTSCAPKSIQTPAGRAAYSADQVVLRIGELQTATIDANRGGALSDAIAIKVVRFCVDANKTLKAVPSGWQPTVATAYHQLRAELTDRDRQSIALYIAALDALLGDH